MCLAITNIWFCTGFIIMSSVVQKFAGLKDDLLLDFQVREDDEDNKGSGLLYFFGVCVFIADMLTLTWFFIT